MKSRHSIHNPLTTTWPAAIALLLMLGLTGPAQAQGPSPMPEWAYSAGIGLRSHYLESQPKWNVLIGASTEFLPAFDGAKNYGFQSGPALDIRYYDIAFLSLGEGLGVNLFRDKNYRGGIAITYDLGRSESQERELRGLGDIDPSPEGKLFFEYILFPLTLRADLRHAIGGYDGLVGDLGAYVPLGGSEKFFVLIGPSVTFADSRYMQNFFGITAEQSARSGTRRFRKPVFEASGGLKSASLGSNATWFLTEHWLLNGQAAVDRLFSDAARSPTTEQETQWAASFTLGYQF